MVRIGPAAAPRPVGPHRGRYGPWPQRRNRLISQELLDLRGLVRGADSIELKLTLPDNSVPLGGAGAGRRPARGPDPPGLLLRHPRPRPQPGRRRGAGPPDPGSRARLGDQAAPGRPGRPAGGAAPAARVRRRGRRPAGRVRVLGIAQGPAAARRRSARRSPACGRSASCSRRSSGRSSPSTHPAG